MKLLSRRRRLKKLEKDLGTGLWRRAHDRYVRGLDRFHQILEGVDDDALHNQLRSSGTSWLISCRASMSCAARPIGSIRTPNCRSPPAPRSCIQGCLGQRIIWRRRPKL